jgi:hypothetical protein
VATHPQQLFDIRQKKLCFAITGAHIVSLVKYDSLENAWLNFVPLCPKFFSLPVSLSKEEWGIL